MGLTNDNSAYPDCFGRGKVCFGPVSGDANTQFLPDADPARTAEFLKKIQEVKDIIFNNQKEIISQNTTVDFDFLEKEMKEYEYSQRYNSLLGLDYSVLGLVTRKEPRL